MDLSSIKFEQLKVLWQKPVYLYSGIAVLALIAIGLLVWLLLSRKKDRRLSRKLSRQDKKVFRTAKTLVKQKKYQAAAQMLESIDLIREAVSILEKGKFIDDAAAMLLRLQRPNRAGVIYARNKRYKEAMACFEAAQMPYEWAKCAKELGEYKKASKTFLKLKKYRDAAECFHELEQLGKAAKCYLKAGRSDKAIELYKVMVEKNSDLSNIDVSSAELDLIVETVVKDPIRLALVDLLGHNLRLHEAVFELVMNDDFAKAKRCYQRSTTDLTAGLRELLDAEPAANKKLGRFYSEVGDLENSGRCFEAAGEHRIAAKAFEDAECFEDAARCYKAVGLDHMVEAMNEKLADQEDWQKDRPRTSATASKTLKAGTKTIPLGEVPKPPEPETVAMANLNQADVKTILSGEKEEEAAALSPSHSEIADDFPLNRLVEGFNINELADLWDTGVEGEFRQGEKILTGDGTLYAILEGELTLEGGDEVLMQNDFFGAEVVFLGEGGREYEVSRDCRLWMIDQDQLEIIMDKNPTLAKKLYKQFAKQLYSDMVRFRNYKKILSAS